MAWVKVLKISDIAEGQSKIAQAGGKEIAFFKLQGQIHALENSCPHRGGPLGEGHLEGSDVTCPWHAWSFDVRTGECRTMPNVKQASYRVKIEGGDISVEV